MLGAHGSTFGGNPLACAAGLAAITTYQDEQIVARAASMGALLQEKLAAALADTAVVREVRGVGMMIGIDLRQKPGPYLKKLMDEYGVLALPAGSSVLRLLPPLIAGEEEIELAVNAIAQALGSTAQPWNSNPQRPCCSGLVAIPSLSTQEAAAAAWLVEQMAASGYDRAYVDPAGNAVGEMGPAAASPSCRAAGPHRHGAGQHPGADRSG